VAITAALAAALASLTLALDEPGTDIAGTVLQLHADARLAVPSYLGLTVIITVDNSPVSFTTLEDGIAPHQVRTSLRLELPGEREDDNPAPSVAVILYAGTPGAFVDLAADLAWLTGRPLTDFARDQHLSPGRSDAATQLQAASVINQAIGFLIGGGSTPEQARRELDARAAATGTDRRTAADIILDTTAARDTDPDLAPY
jgi:hypothetical protein